MAIDRRKILEGSAGLAAWLAALPAGTAAAAASSGPLYFSAARRASGAYVFVILDEAGRVIREIPLAARGHDAVLHEASGTGIVFARRPGTFAVAFDAFDRHAPTAIESRPDRHFYGHGVFSQDGRLLYATENDFDAARGVIGVYDVAAGFRRIGEFDSHGIGPHDVLLAPDGATLVVANGGIETHPDSGREKLNIATMSPSLVFLDRRTGDLLARHELPSDLHKLSIRHLDIDASGAVWFGGQWEGGLDRAPGLVGSATRDAPLRLLPALETEGPALRGYIGSLAVSAGGRLLAASAPRAGRIVFIDTETGRIAGETKLFDGCGIAPCAAGGFIATSGLGDVVHASLSGDSSLTRNTGLAFDNHMVALRGT